MNFKDKMNRITTFIFDYDGVMTDGTVLLQPNGEAYRTANVKDGYALQLAIKMGYRVVIISGGISQTMQTRMEGLGIHDFFLGVKNKIDVFDQFIEENELDPNEILYMGDDIPDFFPMKKSGLACCPKDASIEIKGISDYISKKKGGKGCVRDVIEQVLKLHGKWMTKEAYQW